MYKNSEFGRGMVEILGVLAVMGLLSVTGVVGYRYAMNKHKANAISEQLSIRSQDVARAMQRGNDPDPLNDNVNGTEIELASYDEAGKNYNNGYLPNADDEHFAIEVRKITPEVCKMLFDNQLNPDSGIQKIQLNINGSISDLMTPADCNKADSVDLGFVYKSDLSYTCDPGQYKNNGICEEAPDGYISNGVGELVECTPGTTSNAGHTECVNCSAGEKCGCEKYANGNGICIDCVKNADCTGGDKMCTEYGMCYSCPKYADCSSEQGFTCPEGYQKTGLICCPLYANCTTDNGTLEIQCSYGYYYYTKGEYPICKKCPANAECKGGQETYTCKTGFKETEVGSEMCCPTGATCTKVGDDFMVSCPAETYLSEKECLQCPTNATCAGGDALPTCNAGFVFAEGACQRTNCVQGEAGRYNCYINGKMCGYYCTDTEMKKDSCRGYCSDTFCPADTTWGNVVVGWSGFGCADNKTGIYCGSTSGGWYCTPNKNSGTVCCTASTYAKCSSGTCDPSDCEQFKSADTTSEWTYVADRAYGCKITKNGTSIYCFPKNGGTTWYCKKAPSNSQTPGYCGECTATELNSGKGCTNCFDSSSNCANWKNTDPNVKWNDTKQACIGKGSDGNIYSCQLNAYCYLGDISTLAEDETPKKCGHGCNSITPDSCEINNGLCNQTKCPAGTTYFYNAKFNISGCKKAYNNGTNKKYLFYRPGAWGNYTCFYGKTEDAIVSTCGYGCQGNKDCSDCTTTILSQCMQKICSQNGMEIKDCTCSGAISNNRCCPPGHTYINGACSIVDMTNKCLYRGQNIVDITDDYEADSDNNCVCKSITKCLDESSFTTPVCKETSATLQADENGICQTISPTS